MRGSLCHINHKPSQQRWCMRLTAAMHARRSLVRLRILRLAACRLPRPGPGSRARSLENAAGDSEHVIARHRVDSDRYGARNRSASRDGSSSGGGSRLVQLYFCVWLLIQVPPRYVKMPQNMCELVHCTCTIVIKNDRIKNKNATSFKMCP